MGYDANANVFFGAQIDWEKLDDYESKYDIVNTVAPYDWEHKADFSWEQCGYCDSDTDIAISIVASTERYDWDGFGYINPKMFEVDTTEWTEKLKDLFEKHSLPMKGEPRWIIGVYYG